MLTPEKFLTVANSSNCKMLNKGVSCTFQSNPDLLKLFHPSKGNSVTVDTHLRLRNVSQSLTIKDNEQPINVLPPHNFNYYSHPVFIFNCIAQTLSSYFCIFLCIFN